MPSFTMFSDDDWNSLIGSLQHLENHKLSFESDMVVDKNTTEFKAGEKLHEFGACNNCHFYGEIKPVQGPASWAPNLAMTKERLRPEWVQQWLKNPQAIMPGTKMPAVYLPTPDILESDGSVEVWGSDLVKMSGNTDLMLKGITNYIYTIPGKTDISDLVREYFKANGYDYNTGDDEEEDDWDEDW